MVRVGPQRLRKKKKGYLRKNFHLPLNIWGTVMTKGLSIAWLKPLNSLIGLGEYHSLCVLSYDRSIVSSNASSPYSAFYLLVLFSFHQLHVSCSHPIAAYVSFSPYPSFLFPSLTCFKAIRKQVFLTHLAFLLFIAYRIFLSSLIICSISTLFPRAVLLIVNKYI